MDARNDKKRKRSSKAQNSNKRSQTETSQTPVPAEFSLSVMPLMQIEENDSYTVSLLLEKCAALTEELNHLKACFQQEVTEKLEDTRQELNLEITEFMAHDEKLIELEDVIRSKNNELQLLTARISELEKKFKDREEEFAKTLADRHQQLNRHNEALWVTAKKLYEKDDLLGAATDKMQMLEKKLNHQDKLLQSVSLQLFDKESELHFEKEVTRGLEQDLKARQDEYAKGLAISGRKKQEQEKQLIAKDLLIQQLQEDNARLGQLLLDGQHTIWKLPAKPKPPARESPSPTESEIQAQPHTTVPLPLGRLKTLSMWRPASQVNTISPSSTPKKGR